MLNATSARSTSELAVGRPGQGARTRLSQRGAKRLHRPKDARTNRTLRLVRIAELLADILGDATTPRSILLVDILGSSEAEARLSAGEALEERGYSRYKELALGIERAVDRLPKDSVALQELPYLLAEIPEPSVIPKLPRALSPAQGRQPRP